MKKYGPDERGREAEIVIKHEAPEVPRWRAYEEAQKQAEKVKAQSIWADAGVITLSDYDPDVAGFVVWATPTIESDEDDNRTSLVFADDSLHILLKSGSAFGSRGRSE